MWGNAPVKSASKDAWSLYQLTAMRVIKYHPEKRYHSEDLSIHDSLTKGMGFEFVGIGHPSSRVDLNIKIAQNKEQPGFMQTYPITFSETLHGTPTAMTIIERSGSWYMWLICNEAERMAS